MTMTLVSTVTVGAGGAASIDFTSIPQTGTDLMLVFSGRTAGVVGVAYLYVNGGSTPISGRYLKGTGSAVSSANSGGTIQNEIGTFPGTNQTASTFGNTSVYIPNYAGSAEKSLSVDAVQENNATAADLFLYAHKWASTSAITSLSISSAIGSFVQYSTASLYTITKGSGGATVS